MRKRVLFVCSGNTCRSPMAESLLRRALRDAGLSSKFTVSSAGISALSETKASDFAVAAMKEIKLNIKKHSSQPVTQKLLDSSHAIFCMSNSHKQFLLSAYNNVAEKCFLVREFLACENKDIADPFWGTTEDYKRIRDDIDAAMESIIKFLRKNNEN